MKIPEKNEEKITEDLFALQNAYIKLDLNVVCLKTLIAQAEKESSEWESQNGNSLVSLTEEKENLLADISCGDNSGRDRLDAISLTIEHEEKMYEENAIRLHETVAGLTRKLGVANHELSIAKQNYLDGLIIFFKQELEGTGEEYVKAASQLSGLFMKIIATSSLLEKCGKPMPPIHGPHSRRFLIPSFALDTHRAHECFPGLIFQFGIENVQSAVNSELERLSGLNINMPV